MEWGNNNSISTKPASSNARPDTRSLPFEIDLNEIPLPSPRETLAVAADDIRVFSGETQSTVCGSCGKASAVVEGDTLVCCVCERRFHMRCLGIKEIQKIREWKCFKCLFSNGSERVRGRSLPLLDINASPPREAEGEGFFGDFHFQSSGHGVLARDGDKNGDKMDAMREMPFIGHTFNAPGTSPNLVYLENGFNLQKASGDLTHIARSGFEDIVQRRPNIGKTLKESDMGSTHKGKLWASHNTPLKSFPQNPNVVYMQHLRNYIYEQGGGLLGDGWHVEFIYCPNRSKTTAVYSAPDGSRFESMSDVAGHLGLRSNHCSLEAEDRIDGFASVQKGSNSKRRRKQASKSSRVSDHRESQNFIRSNFGVGSSSANEVLDNQAGKFTFSEAVSVERGSCEFQKFHDGFPMQFDDFFVLSTGKTDSRPSYHCTSQVWPVGYRSCWHDKITGSLFVSEVSDGGDSGPTFKVQRCPCYLNSIPKASTVLLRPKFGCYDGKDEVGNVNSATFAMDDDENATIAMILAENNPPVLNFDILSRSGKMASEECDFYKANSSLRESSCLRLGDVIGEFLVEGTSSLAVWEMASQTLLRICRKIYKQTGQLKFCCTHVLDGVNMKAMDSLDPLSKFCYLSGPVNIPTLIQSDDEFESTCGMLTKWLQKDRFGLDTDFVQEIIERLPGIDACSEYNFLNKRSQSSSLQTVGSGFLVAKRKCDEQGEKEDECLLRSCKRPRKVAPESEKRDCPLGKPLSSKLPVVLIGDCLQVWEFLHRFSEILGLEEPFSLQELEYELMDPWLYNIDLLEKGRHRRRDGGCITLSKSKGVDDCDLSPSCTSASTVTAEIPCAFITMETVSTSHNNKKCDGTALPKAHSSLLKLLVGELLSKVAAYVDPNFDAGESKPRRGRKKDADNLVGVRKTKLDLLSINELSWPEIARRYILAVLSMEGNLDSAEITCRESGKVFHCLQGDGGTLCGSLTGVAGMEADALLLAEATKQIFGSQKSKNDVVRIDQKESDAVGASKMIQANDSEVPEWAQVLEPVRKLPTNVGARIRKCVHDALKKNPPEWAKKRLEHSISKEVYKGNASGPTKRAVVSLLADLSHENLPQKPDKKEKEKVVNKTDLIMQRCRIVLRRAAAADEEKVFCNLLGRTVLNPNDNDDEGLLGFPAMVSRPLDFRTIDLRLAAGSYGGSHEAFLEDVREVWHNIRTACGDQSDLIDLAETLSQNFEALYEKEVLTLVQKLLETANSNCSSDETKKEMDEVLVCASASSLPKAPWDEGVCKVCGIDKDDDNVLLCDSCDSEYHTYCLNPPLVRIPEGNWYCPSCVAGQLMSPVVACGTQVISRCRKRRSRGQFTHNHLEALAQLANTLELKEYWEFSVAERIFLLKFLCDEALNSAVIREHLDRCSSVSADLQQKLRLLSSELKNLKFKEEILVANLAKVNLNVHNGVREMGTEGFAAVNDGKLYVPGKVEQLEDGPQKNGQDDSSKQLCWSFSNSVSEKTCTSILDENLKSSGVQSPIHCPQPVKDQTLASENLSNSKGPTWLNELPQSFSSHQIIDLNGENAGGQVQQGLVSSGNNSTYMTKVSQAYNLEILSVKNDISVLQDSIIRGGSELLKVSVRKEYLGRDSFGRRYWIFGNPGTSQWLVVNGNLTVEQGRVKEQGVLTLFGHELNDCVPSTWISYHSDAEIEALIEWLRDCDARERELKESILTWQRNKLKDLNNTENHVQSEREPCSGNPSHTGKGTDSCILVTKAVTALEKKYGPFLVPEASEIPKKQSRNSKVMYRCECLEPIWPSRHHCVSCHWTFSSDEELEKHNDGKCNTGSQVNEDSLKRKQMMRSETTAEKRSDDMGNVRTSKSEIQVFGSNLIQFQKDQECPFDFEEINTKFVSRNSLKELVRDIGLIGSNGVPSFVPCESPYMGDPTLKLAKTGQNKVSTGDGSENLEIQLQQTTKRTNVTFDVTYDSISNTSPRCKENGLDGEAPKVELLKSSCTSERGRFSSRRKKGSVLGSGQCCVIRECSLRPIVGRASQILRRLKINLLDMDAALPEAALRLSMAHLARRCTWRAFVKSSKSIYEMVQATMILGNMIKSEYLRNDWWYWSSYSVTAKISTLSALALYIYTLDSAIIFEKQLPNSSSNENRKSQKETPPDSAPTNNPKPGSPQVQKPPDLDLTENSKPKSRTSKRRKDSGG